MRRPGLLCSVAFSAHSSTWLNGALRRKRYRNEVNQNCMLHCPCFHSPLFGRFINIYQRCRRGTFSAALRHAAVHSLVEKGEDAKEREEKDLEPGDETPKKATEPEEGSEGSPEEARFLTFLWPSGCVQKKNM